MNQFVNVPQVFENKTTVFVLGGGQSMDDFDWKSLPPSQCIVLNKAHRFMRDAAIFFFADHLYYERNKAPHGDNDFWKFNGEHILTTADIEISENSRIKRVKLEREGFSVESDHIGCPSERPRNTGWQAINLAYLAGARKIVLLGYDCKPGQFGSGASWAHPSTPGQEVYERYINEFNELAEAIKESGVDLEIINANPDSALECWPKCKIEEVLNGSSPKSYGGPARIQRKKKISKGVERP